jgi:hypothetical protein
MNTRSFYLFVFLWSSVAASSAWAVRDPFWPIGYVPESERKQKAEPVAVTKTPSVPQKAPPPAEAPIADDDWAKAKKTLAIRGTTRSVNPVTHDVRTLALINRQLFAVGDTVSALYQNIRFQWRITAISDSEVSLEPDRADRIDPKAKNLK